jgi:hypothetical protein
VVQDVMSLIFSSAFFPSLITLEKVFLCYFVISGAMHFSMFSADGRFISVFSSDLLVRLIS